MSQRIEEILEVLLEVRNKYYQAPNASIRLLRISANNIVADRRKVRPWTVSDKYVRQLKPEIKGTECFDRLLREWLINGSTELEQALCKHRSDNKDLQAISIFFELVPDSEIRLAQEYGFDPQDKMFKEGKDKLKWHLGKERNQALIQSAKKKWKNEHAGQVLCMICSFSFLDCYGQIGEDYIEAHHKLPLSQLDEETEVGIQDLAPVCSNCHRMLHRQRPWLSIEELTEARS